MAQTMDLNKMGLAPMSELEMGKIDGGRWITDLIHYLKCNCNTNGGL